MCTNIGNIAITLIYFQRNLKTVYKREEIYGRKRISENPQKCMNKKDSLYFYIFIG